MNTPAPDQNGQLLELLREALIALAATGEVDQASKFAGRACSTLRHDNPRGWQRFNALLHRWHCRS